MKKNYQFGLKPISVLFLFVFAAGIFAQTPQYNNGNIAPVGNSLPFGSLAATGYKSQWLIGPNEYNLPSPAPAGTITKLYIYISASGSGTYTNLTIKMGQTAVTSFPSGTYTGQLDSVYYNASAVLNATTNTWISFTLDRPFNYNPAQSLVIEVSHCGISGAGFSIWQQTGTTGIIRRNNHGGTPSCVFTYASQDTRVLENGIDVSTVANCNYVWTTQTSGTTSLLQAVWAPSELIGWSAGAAATVRKTINGGTSWTDGNPNPGVITGDVYNIYASDANNALLTTSPGATFIYRTTNGGTNWTQVFTQPGGFIDAIIMKDATTGFAYGDPVGTRWSLFKTVNGGATWDSAGCYLPVTGTEAGWNNAMCIVGNNIWFGTNNTKVYHSTNLGATGSWSAGVTTGNVSTYGVWFKDASTGMCVGTIAQKTTDGGTTWSNTGAVGGTGNMTSVGGLGAYFWLTRGNNTYGTTDFGTTWAGSGFSGTQALWGTSLTTATNGCYTGWSVGATGTIVKLVNNIIGINNNQNGTPNAYMLQQNYPNPFNPTTNISFSLPKSGMVELKIYDVLGRESAVVLNEFRQAGNYSVEFNASQLSSGVYFYTIVSGEFTDTKKMVLIK